MARKSKHSAARGRAAAEHAKRSFSKRKRLSPVKGKQRATERKKEIAGQENPSSQPLNPHQPQRSNDLVAVELRQINWKSVAAWIGILSAVFVFAYWPTLQWLESQWRHEPDYSHGYLVLPLAAVLLWLRRDTFPGVSQRVDWRGTSLILVAVVMRVVGRLGFMDFLDGWSIVPMVGGVTWLTLGLPALRWATPAILFLIMMVPLPFRAETMLSWKLQGLATTLSTGILRIFGLPAIAEGHVIWIDDSKLMIERACSGLRIFVGMIALAFFWASTVRRAWIDRVVILLAAIPFAVLVNAIRISVTGILYQYFPSEEARNAIHDWSGYLMIPAAALLLWLLKCFWEYLYRPVRLSTAGDVLQRKLKPEQPLYDKL